MKNLLTRLLDSLLPERPRFTAEQRAEMAAAVAAAPGPRPIPPRPVYDCNPPLDVERHPLYRERGLSDG